MPPVIDNVAEPVADVQELAVLVYVTFTGVLEFTALPPAPKQPFASVIFTE